jgi:uncharacterized damage-inducible protein DinB
MLARYRMFAGYNAWCNERLYGAAAQIADPDYRTDRGVYFKSLHGTLNHLLVGDRIWMRRFTGQGEAARGSMRSSTTISHSYVWRGALKTNASAITLGL